MTNATIPQIGVAEISDIIVGLIVGLILGLVLGGIGSLRSWYKRRKELGAKLYYPLWLACYNLLLLFDEIDRYRKYEEDKKRGIALFNSAVEPLNDIMYNYGTVVHLKRPNFMFFDFLKRKKSKKDYLNIFFRVKNFIDLNRESVNNNWAQAVIWFEGAKEINHSEDDDKIKEFVELYTDLKNLKAFCEGKDKSLKGGRV